MYLKVAILVFVTLFTYSYGDNCPAIPRPCVAYEDREAGAGCYLVCIGANIIDLGATFRDISSQLSDNQKHFTRVYIYDTNVAELPANTFADIRLDAIHLYRNRRLYRAHRHAFNGTADAVTVLTVEQSPVSERTDGQYSLFDAIHALTALTSLKLHTTGVTSVATNAISGHKQLTGVLFSNCPITTIATQAFNELPALNRLEIGYSGKAIAIANRAFTVGNSTTGQPLAIALDSDSLTGQSFADKALDSIGRQAWLWLNGNAVRYLSAGAFEAFFKDNALNTIHSNDGFDCADSRNQWIQSYPKVWKDMNCLGKF